MTEFLKRGAPGMQSIKDLPIVQDVAPPGGFPAIRIGRRMPNTGPTGVTIFAVGGAVMAYGYYRVWLMIKDRKDERRMLEVTRAPVVPVLQAEDDLRQDAFLKQQLERERRVMGGVAGWEVGASNSATGRWIPYPNPKGVWDVTIQ